MEGNHQPQTPNTEQTVADSLSQLPEIEPLPKMQPKIYAACLAAYNYGRLHGEWIHADQEPDYLMAEITDMLETSPIPNAEEWAIHDYEDFGAFNLSEYERIDTVARVAGGLALHGSAFAHWIHEVGSDAEDAVETFSDAYQGTYDSYEDLAVDWLDNCEIQLHDLVPVWLMNHIRIDYDGLGRDLAADQVCHQDHDGIHLFETR